MKFSIKCLWN